MSNISLSATVADDATLHPSSETATLPAQNLLDMQPGKVWRPTSATASIEVDLGAPRRIDHLALLAHTGGPGAGGRVRLASTRPGLVAAPLYDSGPMPLRSDLHGITVVWTDPDDDPARTGLARNHFLHWTPEPVDARWVRFDLSDAAPVDVGRLWVARAWRPSRNIDYGWSLGFTDPSPRQRSIGGQLYPVRRTRSRVLTFRLPWLGEAEAFAEAFDLDNREGASRPVLVVPRPAEASLLQRQTIYGLMTDISPVFHTAYPVFEKAYRVEELLP